MARIVPDEMTTAWKAQAKTGDQRPVVRATIQVQNLKRFQYDTAWAQGGTWETDRHRTGTFASFIFGDSSGLRELRNIRSYNWERSVGQDAATCTLTLMNSELTAIGDVETNPDPEELDNPGWMTYNRGKTTIEANPWGYTDQTGWTDVLVPDRVVRTYEGYSADYNAYPAQDPNLVQSGTWMIDRVVYNADGTITLEMRDLARLLLDQVVFPPAVPAVEYPLSWIHFKSVNVPGRDVRGGAWVNRLYRYGTASSSNKYYIGKGYTNLPYSHYVSSTGSFEGKTEKMPLLLHYIGDGDGVLTEAQREKDRALYWVSSGQDSQSACVWWEWRDTKGRTPVSGLRLRLHGGPYRVYISVFDGTKWRGKKKIPWKKNGIAGSPGNESIGANIPFVKSVIGDRWNQFDVTLPRKYMAKRIRLTFTRLQHFGVGEHPYRAGLREFKIYTGDYNDLYFERGDVLKVVGNYGDYTWIIKWVCAWAGWYWPPHSTKLDFIRQHNGNDGPNEYEWVTYVQPDPALPVGRVWGDFMATHTYGIADLTVDMFDKKPMMEIIGYVRDLTGFLFFIDEAGGVVWRQPNIWSLGNYLSPERLTDGTGPHIYSGRPGKRGRGARTSSIVEIKDDETLLSYETRLDSTNIRERIFVANVVGGLGTVIKGFNPYPVGLVRVAGWTDQNFATKRETVVMADMISARAMFTYRTSQLTIPGYPRIQIDDQIRIFERVTNETYYHYVQGIKSELDMESGEWTYSINTHWLGERPSDAWVVKVEELAGVTRQYLAAIGYTPSGPEDRDD